VSADANTPSATGAHGPNGSPPKTLDALIAEQGVRLLGRFEDLFGAGRDLWTDDEFASFLEQVRATRHEQD
jgi:hypothetical protein